MGGMLTQTDQRLKINQLFKCANLDLPGLAFFNFPLPW